jgi:hypothetical protein
MSSQQVITLPASGVTAAEVKIELERRRFPSILTDDDYTGIIDAALRELTRYSPITSFVSFTTVADTQDYYVFDPDDATTVGICAGAMNIKDVIWSPGGDWSSLMLDATVILTGSSFHQPSQMLILRQKLDAWRQQFGSQGWDVIGVCGAASAYLRLFPIPSDATTVVVEITTAVGLSNINSAIADWFYQWVEFYVADALANLYATTAGVDLLGFADSKDAMRYWESKSKRYYERVINIQAGVGGSIMRS